MKSRGALSIIVFLLLLKTSFAEISGSITVGGDFDKFYPVTWNDPAWDQNEPTVLKIGRSSVHENTTWRGALISSFTYHLSRWGNGANFIDASMHNSVVNFIAGWHDASTGGLSHVMVIWLRGGGTTYYFQANYSVTATVYDNVLNPLPFQQHNGPAHSYKTAIDVYANPNGDSNSGVAHFANGGNNYFAGNVGIGIATPQEKLAVNGTIRSKEVKVETSNWPDYVFAPEHKRLGLPELSKYIKENKHLPEIPSAAEAEKDGISLGEMNKKLLQKVEELTLYLIEMKQELEEIKIEKLKRRH